MNTEKVSTNKRERLKETSTKTYTQQATTYEKRGGE
jgi:hypothetical protein